MVQHPVVANHPLIGNALPTLQLSYLLHLCSHFSLYLTHLNTTVLHLIPYFLDLRYAFNVVIVDFIQLIGEGVAILG